MHKAHGNVALFVPHLGCPRQCSFCNQRTISGADGVPDAAQVEALCRAAIAQNDGRALELAFFGGSFTALPRVLMLELLAAAQPFLGQGIVGIRVSTRPDCVGPEVLALLKHHRVTAVELGAQSMDAAVLTHNQRGHTAEQVVQGARAVREAGFELGLQMMTGLPGADAQSDRATAQRLIALAPDTVRIYPTVVFPNTLLQQWYLNNLYHPQTLEQAVELGAQLLELFEAAAIRVIRLGLHVEQAMQQQALAGPLHPAFGELCQSQWMLSRLLAKLPAGGGSVVVAVNPRDLSKMIGQRKKNLNLLSDLGYTIKIIPTEEILPNTVRVEKANEE